MNWQPIDVVITLIALTVCVVIGSFAASLIVQGPQDEDSGEIMGGLVVGLMNIVSLYVGATLQKRADKRREG